METFDHSESYGTDKFLNENLFNISSKDVTRAKH